MKTISTLLSAALTMVTVAAATGPTIPLPWPTPGGERSRGSAPQSVMLAVVRSPACTAAGGRRL